MSSVEFDMSEVREFAQDMRAIDSRLARHMKPVVAKAGVNVKKQLRDEAADSKHFKMANSISYDEIDDGYGVEIGPVKGGAGSLANIGYFGGANGGGGTVPDPRGALEAEAPAFSRELAKIAEWAVLGR